jgi:hypothetical protein
MWRVLIALGVAALAVAGDASAGSSNYKLAAVQSCLAGKGLAVSVESKPALSGNLVPYGSLGGLEWKVPKSIAKVPDVKIFIEFGKNAAEAASLRASVVKLFGAKAGNAATGVRGNVMFYTTFLKLTPSETSTVESCLP